MLADLQKPTVANPAPTGIAADTETTLSMPAAVRQRPIDPSMQAVNTAADLVLGEIHTTFTLYASPAQPNPSVTVTDANAFTSFTTELRSYAQTLTGQGDTPLTGHGYTPLAVSLALEPTYSRLSDLMLTCTTHGVNAAEQIAQLYNTLTEFEAAQAASFAGNTDSAAAHYDEALKHLPQELLPGPARSVPHPLVIALSERLEMLLSQT